MKVDLNEIRDGDSIRLACGAVHLVKTVTKPCIREDVNHDFVLLLENGLCHYADRKGNPWSEMKEFQIVEVIQKSEQIILVVVDTIEPGIWHFGCSNARGKWSANCWIYLTLLNSNGVNVGIGRIIGRIIYASPARNTTNKWCSISTRMKVSNEK
jgi:hypothetical protein